MRMRYNVKMKPTKENAILARIACVKENIDAQYVTRVNGQNVVENAAVPFLLNTGSTENQQGLKSGDTVVILHPTKLYFGVNLIFLKNLETNQEGYVYWCYFKKYFLMLDAESSEKN